MEKKDVLEELSYSLTEKERIALLDRINKSTDFGETETEEQAHEKKEKDRELFIKNELDSISWFVRLIITIRSKFSGRNLGDIIIERKMKKLKKSISRKYHGITGFESRNLTPEFGERVFDLYTKTFAFREVYRKIWLEPGVYESFCLFVIGSMYEHTKSKLEEFISIDELVDIYSESGKKDLIIKEVVSRIKEYTSSIPSSVYAEIEESLSPIYNLKDLILFPYTSFFQKFSFTPNRSGRGRHFFKNASAMLCLDQLKQLYIAVNTGAMLDEHIPLNKYLIEFINSFDGKEAVQEYEDDSLQKLIMGAKQFADRIPLLEIIQYFTKEPYLKISYSFNKKRFKDLYTEILNSQLKGYILKIYPDIQKAYIDREIKRIFKGYRLTEFRNYRMYSSIDHQKMRLPFFTHTKSLNILYNYIKCFYQTYFSDVITLLEKGILSQDRIARDRLLGYSIALQEIEEKIEASDKSLGSDQEDGKLFHKLRLSLISEPSQQRMFRSLVINKNREVKSLIDWGEESLAGLEKIFNEIVTSSSNTIKIQLNKHYLVKGKSITLVSLLKERSSHLREFHRLIAQIVKIESD